MIDTFQVAIHFRTEPAARHRMVSTTMDTHSSALLVYACLQGTTIRTIMRTCPIDNVYRATSFSVCRRFQRHTLPAVLSMSVTLNQESREIYYSHAPVPVSQSRAVSDICDTAAWRCEQRGRLCSTIDPYSLEMTRRSNSTTILRFVSPHTRRLRVRRTRRAATGTVNWCNWSE